jgi:hypothetical protein
VAAHQQLIANATVILRFIVLSSRQARTGYANFMPRRFDRISPRKVPRPVRFGPFFSAASAAKTSECVRMDDVFSKTCIHLGVSRPIATAKRPINHVNQAISAKFVAGQRQGTVVERSIRFLKSRAIADYGTAPYRIAPQHFLMYGVAKRHPRDRPAHWQWLRRCTSATQKKRLTRAHFSRGPYVVLCRQNLRVASGFRAQKLPVHLASC